MPKIVNPALIEILQDPYFIQHTAMHLSRERVTLPDGTKLPLILPPCACDDCAGDGKPANSNAGPMAQMSGMGAGTMAMAGGPEGMIEVGQPGSGRQLLEMHHEMIRVFRFLMEHHDPPMRFPVEWRGDYWHKSSGPSLDYGPELWHLDDPTKLPREIIGMFAVSDPDYLGLVFAGVKKLVAATDGSVNDAVDALGRYIEMGVMSGPPDGSGFHNTMHAYLASHEGRAARGAEMNRLAASRFNDYFWSLHLWIDGQYSRLLANRGQQVDHSGLDPKGLDMCTDMTKKTPTTMSMPAASMPAASMHV